MAELTGNEILARCLKAQGVKDIFFIMGGPMLDVELCSIKEGIRLIDTRHEQGAAYMAQAYSRVTQGPGVCVAASGPATASWCRRSRAGIPWWTTRKPRTSVSSSTRRWKP